MAAVTVVKARPCTPVGYEFIVRGRLSEAVVAGNLLVKTGATTDGHPVYSKAPNSTVYIQGIAIQDGPAGWVMDIGKIGEMDGFSGLTPGAPLYSAPAVPGGIDTAAVATAPQQIRAETTTRISYNFMP